MKNNLELSSNKQSLADDCCNIFLEERTLAEVEKKPFNYLLSYPILFSNKDRVNSFKECDQIYQSVLNDLYSQLNEIHNINWTKKSWEILIGFWLRKFVYIIFFKFNNLKNILEKKKIDKVCLSETTTGFLASHESTAIEDLSINTDWSWILYSKIFEYLDTKNIEKNIFKNQMNEFYEKKTLFEKLNPNKKNFKNLIIKSYNFFSDLLLSEKRFSS